MKLLPPRRFGRYEACEFYKQTNLDIGEMNTLSDEFISFMDGRDKVKHAYFRTLLAGIMDAIKHKKYFAEMSMTSKQSAKTRIVSTSATENSIPEAATPTKMELQADETNTETNLESDMECSSNNNSGTPAKKIKKKKKQNKAKQIDENVTPMFLNSCSSSRQYCPPDTATILPLPKPKEDILKAPDQPTGLKTGPRKRYFKVLIRGFSNRKYLYRVAEK